MPLVATLALQTLATMAAYSMPAAAPEVGRGLGVEPALVGVFISVVYGVGMLSALLSPSAIRRFGAARTGQFVMLATAGMLVAAASGSIVPVAASAIVLGLGYGATAPVATHLIVPRTRPGQLNLILSIRQIGVPLGGTLAGLLVPPLVLGFGWQTALLVQVVPTLALLILMQAPRARWDADRAPLARLRLRGALSAGTVAPDRPGGCGTSRSRPSSTPASSSASSRSWSSTSPRGASRISCGPGRPLPSSR